MHDFLKQWPRKRSPLPEVYTRIFDQEYKDNRNGKSAVQAAAQYMESWMHRQIALTSKPEQIVLELGAGTLNHLTYEQATQYDVVEPFTFLYQGNNNVSRVRHFYEDVSHIKNEQYDRIFSVAVLEHIEDLPRALAQCAVLLKDTGVFQAGIPSEGGFLWGLSWRCTTGLAFKLRTGLNYQTVMQHEHLNTAPEIMKLISYFFGSCVVKGFPYNAHHASFYRYIEATSPLKDRAYAYLRS